MPTETPPGRWWAADGNWYPAESCPEVATWVAVEHPARCGPCGRQVQPGVRWWDPSTGAFCRSCATRMGVGAVPAGPSAATAPRWRHDDVRRLRLRRDGSCDHCQRATPAGMWAGWDSRRKVVLCEGCLNLTAAGVAGVAGRSAAQEAERQREEWRREAEVIWGAEMERDNPSGPWDAYSMGAEGERRLGAVLDEMVAGYGWVLHDRVASKNANIDHIVVAPSGVWVIDSKNYRGRVRPRRNGCFGPPVGLKVRGSDRSALIHASGWQVDTVTNAVDDPSVPVRLLLAFPRDDAFRRSSRSFQVDDVWICPPGEIHHRIFASPPVLTASRLAEIAGHLSVRLPAR